MNDPNKIMEAFPEPRGEKLDDGETMDGGAADHEDWEWAASPASVD